MAYKRVLRSLVGSERAGATATATEFTVVLEIYDTLNDPEALSPKKLLNELGAGVADPAILAVSPTYSGFGSDLADSTANFKNVEIGDLECDDDSIFFRTATIKYDSERSAGNEPPTGQSNPDPLTWTPTIVIKEVARTITPKKLMFMGAFETISSLCLPCEGTAPTLVAVDNRVVGMDMNTCQPIQNTAGTPSENPPEIDMNDDEITITKYEAAILETDTEACYKNTINHASVTVDLSVTALYKQTFAKHTLKLTGVSKELKQRRWRHAAGETTRLYWEKQYILLYRSSGWYFDLDNVGKLRAANEADPDGFGGTVAAGTIQPGVPLSKPIERDGHTGEYYHLNLCGQPVGSGAGTCPTEPVVDAINLRISMRYRLPETNFGDATLGLFPLP